MRRLGLLLLLVSCSARREPAVDRETALASVKRQLAPVQRAAPPGALAIREAEESVSIARAGEPGVEVTVTKEAHAHAVFHVIEAGRFEELFRVDHAAASIELAYHVALGPALRSLRARHGIVEALDDRGVARLRTEPAFAVDAAGSVRALDVDVAGSRVTWTLDARGLLPPIAIDPAWTATASMVYARQGGGAIPLPGKKVIVIGGGTAAPTSASEIYDDATGSFTLGPDMTRIRNGIDGFRLADGRAMIVGGFGEDEFPPTADLYDPATNTFRKTSKLPIPFYNNRAAALADGGAYVSNQTATAVWDPKTDVWTKIADPITKRGNEALMLLPSGKLLLVGGTSDATGTLSSVELFDPKTQTYAAMPSLSEPRRAFSTVVAGNKVVVAGGSNGDLTGAVLDTTEIFDSTTNTWSFGPKLLSGRANAGVTVIPDGRLLFVGGLAAVSLLSSTELLDLATGKSVDAGTMKHPRAVVPLAQIAPGESRFLAVGGYNGGVTATAEIWSPLPIGGACTGAGECANGICLDGVCCEKSACDAGETCGGPAGAGHCRKIAGKICASASECASGFCVDGLCCDRACDGTCEACDLAATPGSCATLPPGDSPHGSSRARCPGAGACTALCGGVDAKTCTLFPGAATACGAASCKDGVESSPSSCDGAGACTAPKTAKCEPYACGDLACKRACAVDADCASGYSCDTHANRCVFGAKCDGDHTVIVPGGSSIDCTPYRCAGASCLERCASTDDCVAGTTCDTASGKCVIAAADDSGGGCSVSRGRGQSWLALAIAILLARRRRS